MNIDKLIEFYNNNSDTINIIIVTAVISSLATWLFTKFLPSLSSLVTKISEKFFQKVGGQLAYHTIQGKYLNWVVLHNQDLNLTGIIGSGQKPRLEQIFISLKVTKEKLQEESQPNELDQTVSSTEARRIRNWLSISLTDIYEYFSKLLPKKSAEFQSQKHLFHPERSWRVRKIFSRDHFSELFLITCFGILPIVLLGIQARKENLLSTFLYWVLYLPIFIGIYRHLMNYDKVSIYFYAVIPVLLIISKLVFLILNSITPIYYLIGNGIGCFFLFLLLRDEMFMSSPKANERAAKEVGIMLTNFDNIAILGKPGSGKSTYAQFIALTLAQEKAGLKSLRKAGILKRRFEINEWYLPILIPLGKVSKYINPSTIHSDTNICLNAFKQEILPASVREIFSDAFLRYMLSKGKCILLFDGLDEVSNEDHFRLITNEIRGLVSQYPGNKFILTSRHTGWRGGIGSMFKITEVNELDNEQIFTFAYTWYESLEINRQTETKEMAEEEKEFRKNRARIKADQLVEAIKENENIRNLARNPLLLSMICYVHYNKALPKERLSLYEDCSRLLLEQWDIEKGYSRDDIPLSYTQKEKIMQEIAFSLHSGYMHSGTGMKEVTSDEIIQIIEKVILGFNIDPNQSVVFFNKLVERTGLIISTEQYKNLYGFSHLTFQEFYTAKYLSRNNINIFDNIDNNDSESQEKLSGWWREVIILQSGLLQDISEIVKSLCSNLTQDYLGYRLQIAAQCLLDSTESPKRESESALLRELLRIRTLGEIFESTKEVNVEGKKYLLHFASSRDYHACALKTRVKDISNQEEANIFATELLKMTKSANPEIQTASVVAFIDLANKFEISNYLNQDTVDALIKQVGLDFLLIDILELLKKVEQPLTEQLLADIGDVCIRQACDDLLVNFSTELSNDMYFCEILELVSERSLIKQTEEIKEYIVDVLTKIFKSIPPYRSNSDLFRLPLRNIIKCLLRFMITYGNKEKENLFIQEQLLKMLEMGNSNQRTWAVLLLGDLFDGDKTIVRVIHNQLNSPNSIVRLAAITALRNMDISEDYLEIIKETFKEAIKEKDSLQKVLSVAKEVIFGIGILGSTRAEHIQIAGSLLAIDNSLGLQNLVTYQTWLDIYDERYEWGDMLREVSWKLNNNDIEKLSNDLIEIMSNPKNHVDFLDDFILRAEKFHSLLEDKITAFLYKDSHTGAIGFLSLLEPKIVSNSKEFEFLKTNLAKDSWGDANGSYSILEDNNLIPAAFYD